MTGRWWIDGGLLADSEATIHAGDHGVTVGDGVFETVAVRDGIALAMSRHLQRLERSLAMVGIQGVSADEVRVAAEGLLAQTPGATRLRISVTSGAGPAGFGPSGLARGQRATLALWAGPGVARDHCDAVTAPWRRNEYSAVAGVKSTSYGENAVMAAFAAQRGADECLLANTSGDLCEGIGSNIFVELDGEILTPSLTSGCLPGIARGLAIEWGVAAGLPVVEAGPGELPYEVLERVAQGSAFAAVSSSTRGVQNVRSLNGEPLGSGTLLVQLHHIFVKELKAHPDPTPLVR